MAASGSEHVHAVRLKSSAGPGRVRVAVDGLRRQPAAEREVAAKLLLLPGIRAVEPSALTGNVLIIFDPLRWTAQTLLEASGQALGLPAEPPAAEPEREDES